MVVVSWWWWCCAAWCAAAASWLTLWRWLYFLFLSSLSENIDAALLWWLCFLFLSSSLSENIHAAVLLHAPQRVAVLLRRPLAGPGANGKHTVRRREVSTAVVGALLLQALLKQLIINAIHKNVINPRSNSNDYTHAAYNQCACVCACVCMRVRAACVRARFRTLHARARRLI